MVDERSIEESKQKEAEYTQSVNEAQAAIDNIDAREVERQTKEPSRNIFVKMKDMFERKKAEGELDKKTRQYVKHEYEDKIRAARQGRLIQEQQAKMEDKLARAKLTKEERVARVKEKVFNFGDRLAKNIGGGNMGEMFSPNKVDKMLGKAPQTTTKKNAPQRDPFDMNRLLGYTGGTKGPSGQGAANMLGGGKGPKSGKITGYLGKNSVGSPRNYSSDFGTTGGFGIEKYLPKSTPQKKGKKPTVQSSNDKLLSYFK